MPMMRISVVLLSLTFTTTVQAAEVDISGNWAIDSSVGGKTPIKVNCTFIQNGTDLSGTCTPVMENPEPSPLTGKIENGKANWGYDVMFRGNAGRVDFKADMVMTDHLMGSLSLSGQVAPFTAKPLKE